MIGKKLDARSYTILLLVAMVALMALNLFAQRGDTSYPTSLQSDTTNLSDSQAIREVASATREVARSNQEIARAITELSRAVSGLKMSVVVNNSDSGSSSGSSASRQPSSVQMIDESGRAITVPVTGDGDIPADTEFEYQGSLNIR